VSYHVAYLFLAELLIELKMNKEDLLTIVNQLLINL